MKNAIEIERACKQLNIGCEILDVERSKEIVQVVLKKFTPEKISGHLSIGGMAKSIPLDGNEFTYSKNLNRGKGFLFFDQNGEDRNRVIIIEDICLVCSILENCFGMEYFLVDESLDFLIAVNWYVIEFAGCRNLNAYDGTPDKLFGE